MPRPLPTRPRILPALVLAAGMLLSGAATTAAGAWAGITVAVAALGLTFWLLSR